MSLTVFIVRILLGGLLVIAASLKASDISALAANIAAFRLLPVAIIPPLAFALPYVELLLGAYLLAGLFTRVVAALCTVQFLIYASAVASAVLRHIPAACGCFGPKDVAVADWTHVAFDLALAAASAFIWYGAPGMLALDQKVHQA